MLQVWRQDSQLEKDALESHKIYLSETNLDTANTKIVNWSAGDSRDPQNWSLLKKWLVTLQVSAIGFVVSMAGTINSGADTYAAAKFGVSKEVVGLQTALFLVGFGVSAPAMGPLSELRGRLPVYLYPLLIFSVFSLGSGFAPNIQTRVILRFFAGIFGAAPLSNAGGTVADMSGPIQRSYLFPVFSFFGFIGVPLGNVFGGWIGERTSNQGWCDWVTAATGIVVVIILALCMPETLSAQILKSRAKKLRQETGDDEYMTSLERKLKDSQHGFFRTIVNACLQPVIFLATEPITLCFSLYLTIVYIVLFGDLESYPIIFGIYGWGSGEVGSVFGAVALGMCVTGLLTPLTYWHYKKCSREAETQGFKSPPPETRLVLTIYGTWAMPIGLFWGAWTAYRSIPPYSLIASQFVFGFGSLCCFISSYLYIIDVYQVNAASPLSSLVLLRYTVAGGGSIMFTRPMFEGIGIHASMSLLGGLAIFISFVPILFYCFGPKIRERSKYAMSQ